jgi:hypothetical protein
MSLTNVNGLYSPFEYAELNRKPYDASGADEDQVIKAVAGAGDYSTYLFKDDIFDFWMNVKSMYWKIDVSYDAVGGSSDQGGTLADGFGGGSSVHQKNGFISGLTRRFWTSPNRSPGVHLSYRAANGIVNPSGLGDIRIIFDKAIYGINNSRKTRSWFVGVHVEATMNNVGAHITGGGTDGYLDFKSAPNAQGSLPFVPNTGLTCSIITPGVQADNANVLASIQPIERYDYIQFTPRFGPPGTQVKITLPAVSPSWSNSTIREAFRHVKKVGIGYKTISTFDPFTHITGTNKEEITVTIPVGAETGPFTFESKYDNAAGSDDYYFTRENFVVT